LGKKVNDARRKEKGTIFPTGKSPLKASAKRFNKRSGKAVRSRFDESR